MGYYTKKPKQELKGSFLYKDEKNRTIYSNPFMKNYGYLITSADIKKFSIYQMRFPACLLLTILIIMFLDNVAIALIVGVVLYLISTSIFLFIYLPKLNRINNFVKPKTNSYVENSINNQTYYRLFLVLAASLALSILTIYNSRSNNYQGWVLIANYLFAAAAFIFFCLNLYIIVMKKIKEKKKNQVTKRD